MNSIVEMLSWLSEPMSVRSVTCERLMGLAGRVEDGEDIAEALLVEAERIGQFAALDMDCEFEGVRSVQETMGRSLTLYLEGCSLLGQGVIDVARSLFLEANQVMLDAEAKAAEAIDDVQLRVGWAVA